MFICPFICPVITYGHNNEKCENKYTIFLKLNTFKVQPVNNQSTVENPKKNFFYSNLFQIKLSKSGVFD